jgi:putative tryptophan/tyrosine transport system substrate-binding protein
MMDRRRFLLTSLAGASFARRTAEAQQVGKAYRIGFLILPAFLSRSTPDAPLEAFRYGLRDAGYVEGKNLVIDYRTAAGNVGLLPNLAAYLAQTRVDVFVTASAPATRAAMEATRTIPIVMAIVADPVRSGFVASLGRPGGNVTGLSMLATEVSAKQVQLLKELLPRISSVAVVWDPRVASDAVAREEIERTAQALRLTVRSVEVSRPSDYDAAFGALAGGTYAVLVLANAMNSTHLELVTLLAARHRFPVISGLREFAEAGSLMTYGPSQSDLFRGAAVYVAKILNGAKPADLPVEQPRKFEFVINLKTARALGLTIPPSLLLQADHLIQ